VWGSAVAVAVNLHLLTAMPDLPGGLHAWSPMLEFDTTPNLFRDELAITPLDLASQIRADGCARAPQAPGVGVEPEPALLKKYRIA